MSTATIQSPNVKRELDDEYLQNRAKEWLEAVLGARFEDKGLADALADGDILYHVSKLLKELLQDSGEETAIPKMLSWETDFEGKKIGKYLPYSNVDSFLKICKRLRLPDIDLFTPPDVVEKKDIRRVCLCIRALSKKARANQMRVPDFDNVARTLEIIQHDKINGIDHMERAASNYSLINSSSTPWTESNETFPGDAGSIPSRETTTSSTSMEAHSTLLPDMSRDTLMVKPDKDTLIMQFPHQESNGQLSSTQATNAQQGRNPNATRHDDGKARKARKISLWLPIFAGAVTLVGVVLARRPRDAEIYEVQAGDTLSDISRRTGKTGWKKLVEMNPGIKDPNLIYPTERLKLHSR